MLVTCPECGTKVSERTERCPKCGFDYYEPNPGGNPIRIMAGHWPRNKKEIKKREERKRQVFNEHDRRVIEKIQRERETEGVQREREKRSERVTCLVMLIVLFFVIAIIVNCWGGSCLFDKIR